MNGPIILNKVREQLADEIFTYREPNPSLKTSPTSAAQSGVPIYKIRQQTGHASDTMLACYIRDGNLFLDNAAGALL